MLRPGARTNLSTVYFPTWEASRIVDTTPMRHQLSTWFDLILSELTHRGAFIHTQRNIMENKKNM